MARPHPRGECGSRAQGGPAFVAQGGGQRLSGAGRWQVKRFLAAFALVLLAAPPAMAANIRNIDLGKAAQVWFAEDHTVPIVAFNISLPAGSAYDPAGKAGLASFTGSLIDEGAGGLDSKAFHEALANRAISFSARAERDYLVISISTLKENAPEALHLLQLALTRPRFDSEPLTRVRAQVIQSLQQIGRASCRERVEISVV